MAGISAGTDIIIKYSDSPYSTWNGPITLASGVASDDISAVTALPNNTIGVMWSDQVSKAFGYKYQTDGDTASTWSTLEVPISGGGGNGWADDHINLAVASDSTLYAAVKSELNGANIYMLV